MSGAQIDAEETTYDRGLSAANGILSKLFSSCADEPKGSVHRAWGISLIFVILYFVISIFESEYKDSFTLD